VTGGAISGQPKEKEKRMISDTDVVKVKSGVEHGLPTYTGLPYGYMK